MARAGLFSLLVAGAAGPAAAAPGPVVTTSEVRAELVADAPDGLAAGRTVRLGLKIEHQPHWHTYWKNPGDSGLATTLTWQLPGGLQPSEVQWPTPSRLPIGPLMNFGYEGTLLLPVQLTLPANWQGDKLQAKLQAQWLVCKEVCIPQEGEFALEIPAQAATVAHSALFAQTLAKLPQTLAGAQGSASVQGTDLVVQVQGLPSSWQGKSLVFFPEQPGVLNNAAQPTAAWQGGTWSARLPLDPQRTESPQRFAAVLTQPDAPTGLQVELAMAGPWPAVNAVAGAPAPPLVATPASLAASGPTGGTLLGALLLALVGGALLNLMPCVFPVLSLKLMSLTQHNSDQGANRSAIWASGLAYTAGVVLSFLALAGLMLALRSAGEHLGWGFQLQSPWVVALLAALFTLIGLNLAGVFELGSVLPSSLATLRARHPVADSALTGVLAAAVASPCTAPFMGAALGFALGLPAWQALMVFAALGLGMALPYLLACAWPAWARHLPRPGPWMLQFKVLMAFPMFATVVWLLWVLGQQVGLDGAAAAMGFLVALAFAAWAWGSPLLAGRARWPVGLLAAVCLAWAGNWAAPALRETPAATVTASANTGAEENWQPWSSAAVAQALNQGRSVFVDFTAAWCVTCQFNKRTTLAEPAVKAGFAAKGVVLLRADWTRRDSAITAELARLQRSGVPVYAVYQPGGAAPLLLPEILRVDEVLAVLSALPSPR